MVSSELPKRRLALLARWGYSIDLEQQEALRFSVLHVLLNWCLSILAFVQRSPAGKSQRLPVSYRREFFSSPGPRKHEYALLSNSRLSAQEHS